MLRIYLLAGFLGSILMYAGDMLLYGTTAPFPSSLEGDSAEIKFLLQQSTPQRILIGGAIGPFAAALYMLGFLHIPTLALAHCQTLAWILLGLFILSFTFGGAYHLAWIYLGDVAQINDKNLWTTARNRLTQLHPIVFGLLFLSTLFLSLFILFNGLSISPWYTCITPMVLVLFLPAVRKIPQPIGIWIWGGWCNLIFTIYYVVLLLTIQ